MDGCIAKFVEYQIKRKRIKQADAEVYQYGYRLLIEKTGAFLMTFLIAFLFQAWMDVFLFCVAFIPIRVYSGGYHAKRTISCMMLSGIVLMLNILLKRWVLLTACGGFLFVLEIILCPVVLCLSPVENPNRKIVRSERGYFRLMVIVVYVAQLLFGSVLLWLGWIDWVVSFVLAHVSMAASLVAGRRRTASRGRGAAM